MPSGRAIGSQACVSIRLECPSLLVVRGKWGWGGVGGGMGGYVVGVTLGKPEMP